VGTSRPIIGKLKGRIARDKAADSTKQQRNGSVQMKPLRQQTDTSVTGRERSQGTGTLGKKTSKKLG